MLKFAKLLKTKSSLITTRKCSTDAYSPANIEKTRKVERTQYVLTLAVWQKRTAEKYLNYTKQALIASDEFPVTIQYEGATATNGNIVYVVHHLKKLGYSVSHIHQVTKYSGWLGFSQPSASLRVNLPKTPSDESKQL